MMMMMMMYDDVQCPQLLTACSPLSHPGDFFSFPFSTEVIGEEACWGFYARRCTTADIRLEDLAFCGFNS